MTWSGSATRPAPTSSSLPRSPTSTPTGCVRTRCSPRNGVPGEHHGPGVGNHLPRLPGSGCGGEAAHLGGQPPVGEAGETDIVKNTAHRGAYRDPQLGQVRGGAVV